MVQEYRALKALAAVLAVAVLLSGCPARTRPEPPGSSVPGNEVPGASPLSPSLPTPPVRAPPPRENHLSPATSSLVTQARTLVSRGDLDGASPTLARAFSLGRN